jgi:hypothetical protein
MLFSRYRVRKHAEVSMLLVRLLYVPHALDRCNRTTVATSCAALTVVMVRGGPGVLSFRKHIQTNSSDAYLFIFNLCHFILGIFFISSKP